MKIGFFVNCLLMLVACSGKKAAPSDKGIAQSKTSSGPEPPVGMSSEKSADTGNVPINAGKWLYEKTADQEGQPVYKASTTSPTLLEFDFPYNGGSTATLTVRKRSGDTHVYIRVSKGQFNRSFQGGQARVRFDANPFVDYTISAAENGSANIIFFDREQALIDQLKQARKMVVDAQFAGQGPRRIEFQTAGLVWNH